MPIIPFGSLVDDETSLEDLLASLLSDQEGILSTDSALKPSRQRSTVELLQAIRGISSRKDLRLCGLNWKCGSGIFCPRCTPRLNGYLIPAVAQAVREAHFSAFATFNIAHRPGDKLLTLKGAMSAGWTQTTSGADWSKLREKHGVSGWVRAWDFTYSEWAGWNPHIPVIFTFEKIPDLTEFRQEISHRWVHGLRKSGHDALAVRQYVRERYGTPDQLARYLLHNDPMRHTPERNGMVAPSSTIGDILGAMADAVQDGDIDAPAIRLWREYEGALFRQHAVTPSQSVRPALTEARRRAKNGWQGQRVTASGTHR
ncbi:hypothetical protein GCM10025866_13970 [Naasia aerilata]|uniref:Replication protein n=2 Tax=Naasia aerilata TaxID=1162966 RepID=A0ABN6XPX1_9MICO|nr:hypothetical protein GCM10025866_13970 [Naasia aerilata]